MLADPELRELAEDEYLAQKEPCRGWSARSASCCCRRTRPMSAAPS